MLHPGIDDLHCGPPEPLGTRQYVQRRMPFFAALRKASLTASARVRGFRGNPPGAPGSPEPGGWRAVAADRPYWFNWTHVVPGAGPAAGIRWAGNLSRCATAVSFASASA